MDVTPEISTICLIALGAGLLVILGGFLMVRIMRGSIFGLGMILMRLLTEGKEEATVIENEVQIPPHAAADLHAQAQSLDFDAAVAKYEQQNQAHSAVKSPPPSSGHPSGHDDQNVR